MGKVKTSNKETNKEQKRKKRIMNKKVGFLIFIVLFILPFLIQPEVGFFSNFAYGILSLVIGGFPVLLCIIEDSPDESIGG